MTPSLRKYMTIFMYALFFQSTMYTKSSCIIIHGTWASSCSWYQSGGDFFDPIARMIEQTAIVDELVSFSWSGNLGLQAHEKAAKDLCHLICQYDSVILIGHSHGATVGIVASMNLGKINSSRKYFGKIKKFYALGVPVDPQRIVYPDMNVIQHFYNIFSFGDLVQPLQGVFDRIFVQHDRCTNIAVVFDTHTHPSHSQLHHPVIAKHLLCIPEIYQQLGVGNFDKFQHAVAAEINFLSNGSVSYRHQTEQLDLLRIDKIALELQQLAFFRNKKNQTDQ